MWAHCIWKIHHLILTTIIQSNSAKRIALHFIYEEVSAEKLIEGWTDGFRENHNAEEFKQLEQRLKHSYRFFENMHAGDTIFIDYIPNLGTRLSVNHQHKGIIEGDDFYRAALKVWIGKHPAQQGLKQGMLGI